MAGELDERYICSICCEIFNKPVYIKTCKHTFCSICVYKVLPNADGFTLCPICRNPFSLTELQRHTHLESSITIATITCPTCGLQCPLTDWSKHSSTHSGTKPHPSFSSHQQIKSRLSILFTYKSSTHFDALLYPSPGPNRSTFACPLCTQHNLSCIDLVAHVNSRHPHSRDKVVCPICVSMPWGVANQPSSNFVLHLNKRHKFEYDTYVDYEQDEDVTLQAVLQASLTDH